MEDLNTKDFAPQKAEDQPSVFDEIMGRPDWGGREAILGEEPLTYGEFCSKVESLAGVLKSAGVRRKSIVGVCLQHGVAYMASLLAIHRVGAVTVPINPRSTENEREYIRANSLMEFLITQETGGILPDNLPQPPEKSWDGTRIVGPMPHEDYDMGDDDCMIVYTSGSMNRPKGVVLTSQAISNNTRAVSNYLALCPQDRTIVFTPSAYSYAVSQSLTHLWVGASIMSSPYGLVNPIEILKHIEKYRLTGIATNPPFFRFLKLLDGFSAKISLDSIRYVMHGGQLLDPRLAIDISHYFQMARIVNIYGCTENSPRISFYWLPPKAPERDTPWPNGQAVQGTVMRIVDESDKDAPPHALGQIIVKGDSLMRCYWREPEMTQTRLRGGWLRTGDMAFWDANGFMNLIGRFDNIINVGHEKVSPEEVEFVIKKVPGVEEVAVIPMDDPILEKAPLALMVINADQEKTLKNVKDECFNKLSSKKVPKKFLTLESLPRNQYGKLDRKKIGELAEKMGYPNTRRFWSEK